jgi:hypothetical protein
MIIARDNPRHTGRVIPTGADYNLAKVLLPV